MIRTILIAALALAACGSAMAQERLHLRSNEAQIDELLRDGGLSLDDPLAAFATVLKTLPDRVQVYPTENYYYFRVTNRGLVYTGNIRLAATDRDQGKIDFAYGEEPTEWNPSPKARHAVLGAEQGVKVEKAGPLTYRVSHAGKTVTFELNDLSKDKPPAEMLKADETFLGPVFDESGVQFFLVFNTRLKIFHFVLDETQPVADQFTPLKDTSLKDMPAVLIGKRTGFAFYELDGRKILVGVSERQSRLNTMLDGPFDQLPENFIDGEALRDAIVAADPRTKGKIDRLGNFISGDGERYLINPYMLYREPADLKVFSRCVASRSVKPADRTACFVIDDTEAQRSHPRPLALKRR